MIYQAQRPFEEVAAGYAIRNDQERAALRQEYAATRALYTRWQQELRAGVPTAPEPREVARLRLPRRITTSDFDAGHTPAERFGKTALSSFWPNPHRDTLKVR